MRLRTAVLTLTTLIFATQASAQWMAKVEDDIFSGGKKAVLIGEVDNFHAFVFDCDAERLTFALIGKNAKGDNAARAAASLIVKVDQGQIQRFAATTSQRNDTHWQALTSDREQILNILTQIRDAESGVQIGVQVPDIDFKWSGVASTAGSTKETDRFVAACKLK